MTMSRTRLKAKLRGAPLVPVAALLLWSSAALLAGVAGGCSYDPRFADGTLKCSSSGECPEGYLCRLADRTCVSGKRDGGTTMMPDAASDRGGTGDAPPGTINRFIGSWTLDSTSTVTTRCANSAVPVVTKLSPVGEPSIMTITAGVPGQYDLDSQWLCPLHLRVDDTGAHLFDNRPCSAGGPAGTSITTQTWTATQFDILANTGTSAMHVAAYTRVDQYADGSMVTCMQMVTAPLNKM